MKIPKLVTRVLCIIASLAILSSCANISDNDTTISEVETPQADFFNTLSSLCGQRYAGVMTFPKSGQDSFAGKTLIAKFESCDDKQVRIPFSVGEDHSRTWIISKISNGLQLKHDHRHKDGTPDEINLYGGDTQGQGTPLVQSFFADAHTASIIPDARTNVWTMRFNADKSELTYHLERHKKHRFTAVLKRVSQ